VSDTWISGGGVFLDTPLPVGTRIRLSPTGRAEDDVEVYVEDGAVHVVGHRRPLFVIPEQPNHVIIEPT
jgi:hypothetical protein